MSPLVAGLAGLALAEALLLAWLFARSRRQLGEQRARLQAEARREAEAAAAREREAIHADLHDDLGARLLQLVYEAPTPRHADLARAALQDLRDVVSRSRGAAVTPEQLLADIRAEATQRLAAAGSSLRWELRGELPAEPMPPERALHLYRIVREAISNALRHAGAKRLRIRVRATSDRLELELTDDGPEGPPDEATAGRGMRGMRERAGSLAGDIAWLPGTEGGTKVLLSVPLATDARD